MSCTDLPCFCACASRTRNRCRCDREKTVHRGHLIGESSWPLLIAIRRCQVQCNRICFKRHNKLVFKTKKEGPGNTEIILQTLWFVEEPSQWSDRKTEVQLYLFLPAGKSSGGTNGTLSASSNCSSLNSTASMGSSSSMSNLGGAMTRPNSMGAVTPSDSTNCLGRNDSINSLGGVDTMNSLGRMDSMRRSDSMNSLGCSDPMNSLGRLDNMGRSDSMNNMGRGDSLGRGETVKYGSPMLPSFMQEDNYNPNERDKQVITYEWVSSFWWVCNLV